jgi:hypothetical protein
LHRAFSLLAPPLFLTVWTTCLELYWRFGGQGSWLARPDMLLGYAAIVLGLGYFYVLLAWLGVAVAALVELCRSAVEQ